ncbi:MAG: hypothetical protein ACYCQI_02950 [Gammaproteobacteria bacterium]
MAETENKVKGLAFHSIKDDLKSAIIANLKKDNLDPSEFTLIENFINQPVQSELANNIVIGGSTIPMVAVLRTTTGQLLFYALKALLPDLKI